MEESRFSRAHYLIAAFLLAIALASRFADVHASLPYYRHPDEGTWADIAMRMCRTGDMNPHHFRKPSLPVYLMAVGFALGVERARWRGEIVDVDGLGGSAVPYYAAPTAAEVPKCLFAAISVFALLVLGILAASLTRRRSALWLAPLAACSSSSYYALSWAYLNVDIVGAFFVLAAVAYPFVSRAREQELKSGARDLGRAVVTGVLAGLAVGSKYNLFPVVVSGMLWFLLVEPLPTPKRWQRAAVVAAGSVLTFIATTPYLVLDTQKVVADALAEVQHYATGHGDHTRDAGWPMFQAYLDHFVGNYGLSALLLAAAGAVAFALRDWRRALVLYSFPAMFVPYMSMQRVFFDRNVVVVHLFIALGIAFALLTLPELSAAWLERHRNVRIRRSLVELGVQGTLLVALLLTVPWATVVTAYRHLVEPRNHAARWLVTKLERGTTLFIDKAVAIDPRSLPRVDFAVVDVPASRELLLGAARGGAKFAVLAPEPRAQVYLSLLQGAAVRARFGGLPPDPGNPLRNVGPLRNDREVLVVMAP